MKILLVQPAGEKVRIKNEQEAVPKRNMLRFSVLPLTIVAALTPSEHQVDICDENVEKLDFNTDADVVGISFMTALAERAYDLAAEFRKRRKIIVAGGYHPTFCTDEVKEHFDSVIVGDAEGLWQEFIGDIGKGAIKKVYRHDSLCDLKMSPIPRNDLINRNKKYYATTYAIQTGRGCAHSCKYCSITAFHRNTYRRKLKEAVMEELKTVPKNFIFVDDNIISEPEFAKQLFRAMVPLKKRWVSQCSLKIADDQELLSLAAQAGCKGLFIGIETLNEGNLEKIEKTFNERSQYLEKINKIRTAGIGIIAGIIVGLDQDKTDVFENMLRFLLQAEIDAVQVNIFTPLPGTSIFEEYTHDGRIFDHCWAHYDFRHCVFCPKNMTSEELQAGADWLYHEFYRLDRILFRFMKSFLRLGLMPALLGLKLNLTYRYDNIREHIVGRNPFVEEMSFFKFIMKSFPCLVKRREAI
ncbi:MAG: radical SAM protein [bacterium]|nr:radical SAM protein [bacterium]